MDAHIQPLPNTTRSRLRSTQILTSLPEIVSELLQNSLDAGAHQVDIGIDCAQWTCWVRDDGCGMSKDGMDILSRGLEAGRYGTSKAYAPDSLDHLSTFGFRGEALASCADICCLEISSRTARSKDTWSVIVKVCAILVASHLAENRKGFKLDIQRNGPSLATRESRNNAYAQRRVQLPIRRLTHYSTARTLDTIRRQIEAFALVFPDVAFTLENTESVKEEKDMILRIPKTKSTLRAFRHIYGRALAQHVEDVDITSEDLKLEGFISLDGAQSKAHQFLYINRHPISPCDLHHIIDTRFASSTFAKHAYDEEGESNLRGSKTVWHSGRTLLMAYSYSAFTAESRETAEPAKAVVNLRNKTNVVVLLGSAIDNFLQQHGFVMQEKRCTGSPPPRKRVKLEHDFADDSGYAEFESNYSHSLQPSRLPTPEPLCTRAEETEVLWTDPNTGQTYVVNTRTGNSYRQSELPAPASVLARRTILRPTEANSEMPDWIQNALEANDIFAIPEKNIPHLTHLPPPEAHDAHNHACHGQKLGDYLQQGESIANPSAESAHRFHKSDLRDAVVIEQVDRKFIACLMKNAEDRALVLIDQHAADERVRVERFLKQLCLGYLANVRGAKQDGIKVRKLDPPIPTLVTRYEATQLVDRRFREAFALWGFEFADKDKETQAEDYSQVFVSSIPEVVADKLLMDHELRDFVKAFLARSEVDRFSALQQALDGSDDDFAWLEAMRWLPQQLLDLVNSKACRGECAIMFNDPLTMAQCQKLVNSLAQTAFPFQCAHGRPSLVPLIGVAGRTGRVERRKLEWARF
ncbi:Mismatch repair-related protein [Mycena kentingensis (nom. inval.)]|nr:Mismatch repair-related protein [Mycena kentingensis (nom. inval.)]